MTDYQLNDFCAYCGASIPHRRGEGTCPACDPEVAALQPGYGKGKTTVVNIKNGDQYDVYIGRPSIWGNPFLMSLRPSGRERAIKAYESYLRERPWLVAMIPTLKGLRLGCYCAPLPCHGDILARLADET